MSTVILHPGHLDLSDTSQDREAGPLDTIIFYTDSGERLQVEVDGDHLEVYYSNGTLAVIPRTGNVVWVSPVPNGDRELRKGLNL